MSNQNKHDAKPVPYASQQTGLPGELAKHLFLKSRDRTLDQLCAGDRVRVQDRYFKQGISTSLEPNTIYTVEEITHNRNFKSPHANFYSAKLDSEEVDVYWLEKIE